MFKKLSHAEGLQAQEEILFSTSFNYLFPEAARSTPCLLPQTEVTVSGLRELGNLMADQGCPGDPKASLDSKMDAVFTYFGQFIDHDITARTDRDGTVTALGKGEPIVPLNPDLVVSKLRNGRRPQLDLDSVFGDGPGLAGSVAATASKTQSQVLYDEHLKLHVFENGERVDLPLRSKVTDIEGKVSFPATVADSRNDENVNVSQLHTNILRFYNAVYDAHSGTDFDRYVRSRQLVRWAYQYAIVHDYLMHVCDPKVVHDTLVNGPRYFGPGAVFMPLEFSVAAFRFAHSTIRPFYKLNDISDDVTLMQLLGTNGNPANFAPDNQLVPERVIDWKNFIGSAAQKTRKIDTKIAHDLFTLPFRPGDPVLSNLAKSNLFRGYNLSIPTGQAICDGFGVFALTPKEIVEGEDPKIAEVVQASYFDHRTPLWYYVLREAAVQQEGERLGEIGSRLVCETLIGLLKSDPNSYLNNQHDHAIKSGGIDVKPGFGGVIGNIADIIKFAGNCI